MRVLRIDHVSLNVSDRPRSLGWYEDILGMRAGQPGPDDEPVFLGESGAQLALFADGPARLRHVALATDDDGRAAVLERLDALAVPYRAERHRDSDSVYFRDPDGHTLEVMVPRTR